MGDEEYIDNSMDIHSPHGTQVRYMGEGGYPGDKEEADAHLKAGEIYTIDYTEIRSWHTRVYLLETGTELYFNSVLFDKVGDDV